MVFAIIIRGPAGSGKTELAKGLAKSLSAHFIAVGSIRRKHGLLYSLEDKIKANKFAIKEAHEHLKREKVVIFDEVFNYKDQVHDLIDNLSYRVIVISLKAPLKECILRNSKRKREGEQDLNEDQIKMIYNLFEKLDLGLTIDGTQNKEKVLEQAIEYIKSLITQQ